MKKYVKQRDEYRCGPIALLNALIWAGQDVSYEKDIDRLTEKCHCSRLKGTYHINFYKALRQVGKKVFDVNLIWNPSIKLVDQHLQSGGSIIINYRWQAPHQDSLHYASLVDITETGKTISVVNAFVRGPALYKIRRHTFIHKFRCRGDHEYSGWFLTKKD